MPRRGYERKGVVDSDASVRMLPSTPLALSHEDRRSNLPREPSPQLPKGATSFTLVTQPDPRGFLRYLRLLRILDRRCDGRLKISGRLLADSPLSRFSEYGFVAMGIEGKDALG